jgi:hypothetical protein
MKQKVIAAIKPLVADRGLKAKEIENLAESYIALKGLTDASTDEEVSNAITADGSAIKSLAATIQSAVSAADTAAAARIEAKYKDYVKPEPKPSGDETPKPKDADNVQLPAELKAILDAQRKEVTALQSQLAQLNELRAKDAAEAEANRLRSLFESDERVKKLPDFWRERYTLDKAENLDTLAQRAESEWASKRQELYKAEGITPPPTGNNIQRGAGDATDLIAKLNHMGEQAEKK